MLQSGSCAEMNEAGRVVRDLADRSEVLTTPCGDGNLVWRRWGEGLPVVLAHGGSGSWTHWIKTIPELAKAYTVYTVDLPGLGQSDMPEPPLTAEHCGEIVAAGVRQLIPAQQRPRFVAFSFGAHVSSFAAVELGDRVAQFVIVGCAALGLPYHGLKYLKEEPGMSEDDVDAVYRTNLRRLMFADEANIDALAIHLQKMNVRQARFRSRRLASTSEIRDNLPRISARLAAIWGSRDATATPSPDARVALLRAHQPDMPSSIIEGAGHWVMYEAADAFNETLLRFLTSDTA